MKAFLKNYRQSPRKVRHVADLLRGEKIGRALILLNSLSKKAALPVKKLLESAVANAKHNDNADEDRLFVKEIQVNEGVTLKRLKPRARGAAHPIRKRTSHISIVLSEQGEHQTPSIKSQTKAPDLISKKLEARS